MNVTGPEPVAGQTAGGRRNAFSTRREMATTMPWVKSAYASEMAVVSAWLAALVPWSATVGTRVQYGRMFMFRFPLFELQVRAPTRQVFEDQVVTTGAELNAAYPGWELLGSVYVANPVTWTLAAGDGALLGGSLAWTLGALLVAVALGLSVAMYVREEATARRLPADEVRVMGTLLAAATLAFAAATVLYGLDRDVMGLPIPVGVLVVGALSVALLRAERV